MPKERRRLIWDDADRKIIEERITWLRQKLAEMRRVGGPDYTPSLTLQGRTQGEIGGLLWVLAQQVAR